MRGHVLQANVASKADAAAAVSLVVAPPAPMTSVPALNPLSLTGPGTRRRRRRTGRPGGPARPTAWTLRPQPHHVVDHTRSTTVDRVPRDDVEEGVRLIGQVLGPPHDQQVSPLVQRGPAREVQRQAHHFLYRSVNTMVAG